MTAVAEQKIEIEMHTCETCKFCDQTQPSQSTRTSGELTCTVSAPERICRRHGPISISDFGITRMQWPPVWSQDWCGEWAQRAGVYQGS